MIKLNSSWTFQQFYWSQLLAFNDHFSIRLIYLSMDTNCKKELVLITVVLGPTLITVIMLIISWQRAFSSCMHCSFYPMSLKRTPRVFTASLWVIMSVSFRSIRLFLSPRSKPSFFVCKSMIQWTLEDPFWARGSATMAVLLRLLTIKCHTASLKNFSFSKRFLASLRLNANLSLPWRVFIRCQN